jgi:hypothetical protein
MTLSLFLDVIVCLLLVATIVYAAMLNRRLMAFRSNRTEMETMIRTFSDACARAEAGTRSLRSATEEATRLQAYLERSQNLRDDLAYLLERGGSLADRLEGGVRSARGEAGRMPQAAAPSTSGVVDRIGERAERPRAAAEPEDELRAEAEAPPARPSARDRLRDRVRAAEIAEPAEAPSMERDAGARPTRADRGQDRISERMAERVAERLAQRAGERVAGPSVDAPDAARPPRDRSLLRAALAGSPMSAGNGAADRGVVDRGAAVDSTPRSKAERELLQALRGRR